MMWHIVIFIPQTGFLPQLLKLFFHTYGTRKSQQFIITNVGPPKSKWGSVKHSLDDSLFSQVKNHCTLYIRLVLVIFFF